MKEVFALCEISRQAHFQSVQRYRREQEKSELYVRLMEQIRHIHPGMGIRTMYEMSCPEGDITYLYCLDQFFYIVLIMDVYSRRIIGYSLADNMRAENNLAALRMALQQRGIRRYQNRLIHHSDKGTQYASDAYTEMLEEHEIQISMCNEVYENTHIERVNDTIKNQYLNRMEIANTRQLERKLTDTINAYNETRPHQSLNKLSPVQFEKLLITIDQDKRSKMKVYTAKLNEETWQNRQLNLFDISN